MDEALKLSRENILDSTLDIIREYYQLNAQPLFSVLSEDCVWMGTGNVLASGAAAIRGFFKDGFLMPPYRLVEPDLRLINTGCETQLMVLGQYRLIANQESGNISVAKQRATFCYRLEKKGWRLYHMHISNEWNELVGNEVFPVQISAQTYRYVRELVAKITRGGQLMAIKTDLGSQFVDTSTLLYIEATDAYCILHTMSERRQVPRPMKELQTLLPQNFYRLHRSYCVNSDYVSKIERYTVTIITGETLPIPKARYMQVREELTDLIEKRKTEKRKNHLV